MRKPYQLRGWTEKSRTIVSRSGIELPTPASIALHHSNKGIVKVTTLHSVFQLGLFMRALRPARTGLRPARFTRALPEFIKKKKLILFYFYKK